MLEMLSWVFLSFHGVSWYGCCGLENFFIVSEICQLTVRAERDEFAILVAKGQHRNCFEVLVLERWFYDLFVGVIGEDDLFLWVCDQEGDMAGQGGVNWDCWVLGVFKGVYFFTAGQWFGGSVEVVCENAVFGNQENTKGVFGAFGQDSLLNVIFALEGHFEGPIFEVNENEFVLKIDEKEMLIWENGALLYKFLTIVDFTWADKVLIFLFNDGLFGFPDSRPEPNSGLMLSICNKEIVIRKYACGTYLTS